jgi:hypothetical protein
MYVINISSYDPSTYSYILKSALFDEISSTGYITATSYSLGEYSSFSWYYPVNATYSNFYFIYRPEILACGDNYRNNMCFWIILGFFIFHFLSMFILITVRCITNCAKESRYKDHHSKLQLEILNEIDRMNAENLKFGSNRYYFIYEPHINEDNNNPTERAKITDAPYPKSADSKKEIEGRGEREDPNKISHTSIVDETIEKIPDSDSRLYNFLYFIFFRNLYVNNLFQRSPLTPYYKTYSKFIFFLYLLFTSVCLLLVFAIDIDLEISPTTDYTRITGFMFISIFFTNLLICLIAWLYKIDLNHRNEIVIQSIVYNSREDVEKLM